jgi:hypothetical protein
LCIGCNTGIAPDPIPKRVGSAEVIPCVLDDLQMCKPVSQQCFLGGVMCVALVSARLWWTQGT